MKPRWIALIPAYEPGEKLIGLMREAAAAGFAPVVVDDGSGEDFAGIFARCREFAIVLTHPENRGKGQALKTGFRYICEHFLPQDVVVTLDAGGQYKVKDAKKLCCQVQEHPEALVLGRRQPNESAPFSRRLGRAATRTALFFSTGKKIRDTQTGLRGCTVALLPYLMEAPGERYEYEINVLLTLAQRGIPIREMDIETIYPGRGAISHYHPLKDSMRIYWEIVSFCLSSFTAFTVDFCLYTLLTTLTAGWGAGGLWFSNIAARVVSASLNFTINRRLVFRSQGNTAKAAAQFFLLAGCILLGNTLFIHLLVEGFHCNRYAAKLCAELFFFTINWLIQRFVIFSSQSPSLP